MPDYGHDLSFGYFLVPNAAGPLLDTAREVETRGLDLIGVQDHRYQRRYVDTWVRIWFGASSAPPAGADGQGCWGTPTIGRTVTLPG